MNRAPVDAADARRAPVDHTGPRHALPLVLLALAAAVFVWSGVRPHDRFTWLLETLPAIAGVPLLAVLYARGVRLTPAVYVLVTVHAMILMVGGKYTYAEVPPFNWLRDTLHLSRNHYDRVGHFAQGFVPAMIAREVLLRTSPLRPGKWLFFLVVCCCGALSACYELVEWAVAAMSGSASDAFLGTQGDHWDTQKDMALAFVGAVTAQVLLSRLHDRQLARLSRR
jgi:putative membrane protein